MQVRNSQSQPVEESQLYIRLLSASVGNTSDVVAQQ